MSREWPSRFVRPRESGVPRVSGPETTLLRIKSHVGKEEIVVGGVHNTSEELVHE